MIEWQEDKFDATRQSDDDWVCHDCGDGGKTPWNPEEGCPRYPCHAHKRTEMNLCPVCYGYIL